MSENSENTLERRRKVLTGTVYSNKMARTIVVEVTQRVMHPKYGKYVKRRRRFKAHDELQTARTGDTVTIASCRPLSRDKTWRLVKVVERAPEF
ncbi:30S ribosomal protein S17 [bacterium]|nr:30S ribosomal protein S17 [bacterium]